MTACDQVKSIYELKKDKISPDREKYERVCKTNGYTHLVS